jgi:predicted HTH domain antitoxin
MGKGKPHSVRFTEPEEREVRAYVERTGETEATVLERVAVRGLREERIERAITEYLRHRDSSSAAEAAGIGRMAFLDELLHRGITFGDMAPETLRRDLVRVAQLTGNSALAEAVTARPDTDEFATAE